MMIDGLNVFDDTQDWDFEKFTTVIFYLHAYYDAYLSDKPEFFNSGGMYCSIPVTDELLTRMDIEESLDEFQGEAEVMQQELLLDTEVEPLFCVVRGATGLTLLIDPVLLSTMVQLPDGDEDDETAGETPVWYG